MFIMFKKDTHTKQNYSCDFTDNHGKTEILGTFQRSRETFAQLFWTKPYGSSEASTELT